MAKNVFISFRFSDGSDYKEDLVALFDKCEDTIDCSENQNRSEMTDETIRNYLYKKLRRSSVTIALITPEAIQYRRDFSGKINDWLYDEIRYSLESRDNNPTNGLIAVYVPEAKNLLMKVQNHYCEVCRQASQVNSIIDQHNLIWANMNNVRTEYKKHKCPGVYDGDWDSYCSLIPLEEFKKNVGKYIEISLKKREELYKYKLTKWLK